MINVIFYLWGENGFVLHSASCGFPSVSNHSPVQLICHQTTLWIRGRAQPAVITKGLSLTLLHMFESFSHLTHKRLLILPIHPLCFEAFSSLVADPCYLPTLFSYHCLCCIGKKQMNCTEHSFLSLLA